MQEVTARTVGPCPVCGRDHCAVWTDADDSYYGLSRLMCGPCWECGATPEQRAEAWREQAADSAGVARPCPRCGAPWDFFAERCTVCLATLADVVAKRVGEHMERVMGGSNATTRTPHTCPSKVDREAWEQCTRHTAWDAKRQQGAFIPLDHRIDYVHQDQAAERAERLKPDPHPDTWPSHDAWPNGED